MKHEPTDLIEVMEILLGPLNTNSEWEPYHLDDALSGYQTRLLNGKLVFRMNHVRIPEKSSAFDYSDSILNTIRNKLLETFPLFGYRDEIRLELSKENEVSSVYFSQAPIVLEFYERIHEENN